MFKTLKRAERYRLQNISLKERCDKLEEVCSVRGVELVELKIELNHFKSTISRLINKD